MRKSTALIESKIRTSIVKEKEYTLADRNAFQVLIKVKL